MCILHPFGKCTCSPCETPHSTPNRMSEQAICAVQHVVNLVQYINLIRTQTSAAPAVQTAHPVQAALLGNLMPPVSAEQPLQAAPPIEAAEPIQPAPPVQASNPVQPKPPIQAEPPAQPAPLAEPSPPVQASNPVQPEPPVQAEPPAQPAPPAEPSPPVQTTQPVQPPAPPLDDTSIQWIPCTEETADALTNRAIVAGYEGHDGSPLWVIRACYEGDVIPGKLPIKHMTAFVAWGGQEVRVHNLEVCVGVSDRVRWVKCRNGDVPPNAVPGGCTNAGETLYIGRAHQSKSLTPGKVHPSHKVMYISFAGQEIAHKRYEVMCYI